MLAPADYPRRAEQEEPAMTASPLSVAAPSRLFWLTILLAACGEFYTLGSSGLQHLGVFALTVLIAFVIPQQRCGGVRTAGSDRSVTTPHSRPRCSVRGTSALPARSRSSSTSLIWRRRPSRSRPPCSTARARSSSPSPSSGCTTVCGASNASHAAMHRMTTRRPQAAEHRRPLRFSHGSRWQPSRPLWAQQPVRTHRPVAAPDPQRP